MNKGQGEVPQNLALTIKSFAFINEWTRLQPNKAKTNEKINKLTKKEIMSVLGAFELSSKRRTLANA